MTDFCKYPKNALTSNDTNHYCQCPPVVNLHKNNVNGYPDGKCGAKNQPKKCCK